MVEKDAVFQSLLDDPLFSSHLDRIVMLTGKGVPGKAICQDRFICSLVVALNSIACPDVEPKKITLNKN